MKIVGGSSRYKMNLTYDIQNGSENVATNRTNLNRGNSLKGDT